MSPRIAKPAGKIAKRQATSLRFNCAVRWALAAALVLAISLPALSADNQKAASLRIHVNVVSMIAPTEHAAQNGDIKLPPPSEVHVINNQRSDWLPAAAAKRVKSTDQSNAANAELVTTVIVAR